MNELPERVATLEKTVETHDEELRRVRETPGELKVLIVELKGLSHELSTHVQWHEKQGERKVSVTGILITIWLAILTTVQFFGGQARIVLEPSSRAGQTEQIASEPIGK